MQQILHIFRKDVRHLWPRALIVLLLMMAHAFFAARALPVTTPETERTNAIAGVLSMLLPLSMWFLIASLILEESLPGDRQFWLTRPYRWPQLLAAKVLFILIFLNFPLFLSDGYILGAQGFPVLGVFPQLLLRQLHLTALFILPSLAIATLTSGMSQFLLAWLILPLTLIVESMLQSIFYPQPGMVGISLGDGSVLAPLFTVVACGIVIWQYARRRTFAARAVLLIVTMGFQPVVFGLASLPLFNRGASAHPPSPNQSNVQVAYDFERSIPASASWTVPPQGFVLVRIPLRVDGVPPKTLLRGNANLIINASGTTWRGSVERIRDEYWLTTNVSQKDIPKQQAHLHATLDLEIVSDTVETRIPLSRPSYFVNGHLLCHIFQGTTQTQLTCRSGLKPSVETDARLANPVSQPPIGTFRPPGVPWGLSPASDLGSSTFENVSPDAIVEFIPRRKIAEFQRTLDAPNLPLNNYILPHRQP